MGIWTLSSAPGTTASVVLANKQSNEQIIAQRRELKDKYIPNIVNDVIKNENGINIDPKLAALIISLFPIAIKVIPSAVKTIKNLINGEGINTLKQTLYPIVIYPLIRLCLIGLIPLKWRCPIMN